MTTTGWASVSIPATSSPPATRSRPGPAIGPRCGSSTRSSGWIGSGIHLNDSVKDCGSRVDRHAHIGSGKIGIEAFDWLLRDRRFRKAPTYPDNYTPIGSDLNGIPMILETPKGQQDGVIGTSQLGNASRPSNLSQKSLGGYSPLATKGRETLRWTNSRGDVDMSLASRNETKASTGFSEEG